MIEFRTKVPAPAPRRAANKRPAAKPVAAKAEAARTPESGTVTLTRAQWNDVTEVLRLALVMVNLPWRDFDNALARVIAIKPGVRA